MDKSLERAKKKLDEFYEANKDLTGKPYDLSKGYLDWITKKTDLIKNEKHFVVPEDIQITRGSVFWAELGHNVDEEYGGRHPVVVLRRGGNTAIAIPLSTQEPTEDQLKSGIYAEIKTVYGGFRNMKRWVNVLNTTPMSIQRFDFKKNRGFIKGPDLDRINIAMKKSGLWK
ncbi:type II toxin-antitoxin system PemK/MazF family toxin [Bacillus subtilis]|uniref:type II toxin-antitoxin system PemK/MazF family toxin n=1 Tax=Bacillus subtilis TaxID=1423 RepID=UPI003EBE2DE6